MDLLEIYELIEKDFKLKNRKSKKRSISQIHNLWLRAKKRSKLRSDKIQNCIKKIIEELDFKSNKKILYTYLEKENQWLEYESKRIDKTNFGPIYFFRYLFTKIN